jgi:hypothetical protein
MKKLQFLITFVAVATLTLIACNKDSIENAPNSTIETQALNREETKMTDEEREGIAKTIREIEGYKAKFDSWRKGENIEERISTKDAGEQIEIICNYYLSHPGDVFEKYEFVTAVAEVGDNEAKEWSAKEAANAFEAVKEQLVQSFNKVEGGDKTITMIDMGIPSFENGKFIMYIQMNVGVGSKLNDFAKKSEARNLVDTRWSAASGFTPNPGCSGAANKEIGDYVNQQLGFFSKKPTSI